MFRGRRRRRRWCGFRPRRRRRPLRAPCCAPWPRAASTARRTAPPLTAPACLRVREGGWVGGGARVLLRCGDEETRARPFLTAQNDAVATADDHAFNASVRCNAPQRFFNLRRRRRHRRLAAAQCGCESGTSLCSNIPSETAAKLVMRGEVDAQWKLSLREGARVCPDAREMQRWLVCGARAARAVVLPPPSPWRGAATSACGPPAPPPAAARDIFCPARITSQAPPSSSCASYLASEQWTISSTLWAC